MKKVTQSQINKIARILAYEYANGWKTGQHTEHIPTLMNAEAWANAHWEMFTGKAELALGVKRKAYFVDAVVTESVYMCSPTTESPSVKFVSPKGQIINESKRI